MARRDRESDLRARTTRWAERLKVRPRLVRIQRMTTKWGSCSTRGTITLAADLSGESEAFQDYVVVHELLHLRVPNHGKVFRSLLNVYAPGWRKYQAAR
jgi:predicted metal-dependent hydrolase